MTSNMYAGEKRWSSTRRSAMTVLGKVPKPLNLPSQRLENHGLDPNAEIVPKGTINWGNRPTGNAWSSLALSPKSDGGSGFSSDVGARPSSGGSGTRPSTAASDKGHEPVPSSWGSNSRPSSASGVLSSSQSALTSLRPHSAETRPGSSSQLSRFAENLTDNSVALVPPGISDKLGGSSSSNDGFNLSSGDFPTLGSKKDNSGRNTDYRDNGSTSRPSSSSGMTASVIEKKADVSVGEASTNANARTGNVDTWRRADSEHFEDIGTKHSMNNWHGGETYAYPNSTMPPQLVDAWRGHHINASSPGGWYRGPPGGPPYRPPLGPGGFPLDHFTYYRSQIQNPGLANTRPMPPPNSRPRGHHPGNPDLYRPHIPDAYMHPSMPIRPGFYPPHMPFEGYYRPHMGFGSAKEHDISLNSMPPGPPPVYNMYSGEHSSDPGKEHARASADGCAGNSVGLERVESVYQHDNQGQCRVLLKQHHETVGKEENSDWKQTVSIVDKRGPERTIENNEGGNGGTNELGRTHKHDTSSRSVGSQKHDSDMSKSNLPFGTSNMNNVNFDLATKAKHSASSTNQVSHVSTTTPKPILIQKIEGLNAKTRACDSGTSIRGNFHANDRNRAGGDHIQSEKVGVPMQDINPKPTTFTEAAIPRVPGHEMQGKHDHYGRRFNAQGGDGWQKKSHNVESSHVIPVGNAKLGTSYLQDQQISEDAVEKPRTNLRVNKVEGETSCAEFDKSNGEAQRAKMREMARERAKQLQKEEEERKKEQKAKALVKLEELNKRTLPADGLVQKVETPATPACVNEQVKLEGPVVVESVTVAAKINISSLNLISAKGVAERNTQITDSTEYKVPAQPSEGNVSRNKPMGHNKQKQNSTRGKILTEKSSGATHVKLEVPGSFNQVIPNGFASEGVVVVDESFHAGDLNLLSSKKNLDETPAGYRKKNNSSGKMKSKVDDDTTVKNPVHMSAPSVSMEHSVRWEMPSDPNSYQVQDDIITIEEGNPKPQRSHPLPKNQHTNRNLEKFRGGDGAIWAPVRVVQTKTEVSEEASGKISDEIPAGKSDTEGQNNQKSKRAEMKRYVPKPVAMGHTQQQVSSSDDQAVPNEVVVEKDGHDSQRMVGSTDPQHKQKKIHGSWRQRESTTNARSSYNVSKGEPTCSDDPDTRSFSEHPDSTSAVVTQSMKDEKVDGQRRNASKSHRNMASNSSHNNMNYNNSGDHPSVESSQKEKGSNNLLKESRGGERNASSHWQPKYQSSSHNQQNRSSGGKNAAAASASASTEGNDGIVGWSESNEERVVQKVKLPPVDQPPPPSKNQDVGKKEMKTSSVAGAKRGGGRPFSPNQDPNEILVESLPADTRSYVRQPQQPSLGGLYKNGNQNSRYGSKGGGGGGGGGYESHNHQHHHQHGNSDRQRQQNNNSRFEYKPVGPTPGPNTSSKKPNNNNNQFEESSAESSSRSNTGMHPKYREKYPQLH